MDQDISQKNLFMPQETPKQLQVAVSKALSKQQAMEISAYQRSIQTLSHSFKFPAQQQDVNQRSAVVSHLNMNGETQCNSKLAKTTMYCISLLFSILTFIQKSHCDLSMPQKWSAFFFPEKTRKLIIFLKKIQT